MTARRFVLLVLSLIGAAALAYRSLTTFGLDAAPTATTAADQAPPVSPLAAEHAALSADQARQALAALAVAERHRGGYERELFGDDWTVTAGCTTRQHVLVDEAVAGTIDPDGCNVVGGAWVDWYSADTPTYTDPSGLDVDHVVSAAPAPRGGR